MTQTAQPPAPWLHTAFYRFVRLDETALAEALGAVRALAEGLGLGGSIVLAPEGINGVAAGRPAAVAAFERALQDDPRLRGAFRGMAFKRSTGRTRPFARMKVYRRPELVAVGVPSGREPSGATRPDNALSPAQWRALLGREDVVVLDNRNAFEYRLGRFRGAVDPGVGQFRDFPEFVTAHAAQWRAQGKQVAMYCTGGIRCEKLSDWMAAQGLTVWQLDGGILHYFAQMPDAARDWEGDCFVFDNRIALNPRLEESGLTAEAAFAGLPDEAWRLERARRLRAAVADPDDAADASNASE